MTVIVAPTYLPDTQPGWLPVWLTATGLERQTSGVWTCPLCVCAVMPEPGTRVMLTRASTTFVCQTSARDCSCHTLPRDLPYGAGTVSWLDRAEVGHRWMCGMPDLPRFAVCANGDCGRQAVAFVNGTPGLPGWRCATHLGVEPLRVPTRMLASEPEEFARAREAAQVALALSVPPSGG